MIKVKVQIQKLWIYPFTTKAIHSLVHIVKLLET